MATIPSSREWRVFGIVWGGQLVSLVGSGLTTFVLGLWVYQQTQSVTQFALILLSGALPRILFSPLAGVLADRWDRRWLMLLSDAGAGLSVLAVALLYFAHHLAVWQIYVATALGAACNAFQVPAYVAVTTLLVPSRQLGRVNGLLQLGLAAQDVLSPPIAGLLISTLQIGGVLMIDVGTFVFAILTLLVVRFPATPATVEGQTGRGSMRDEMLSGWTYIARRPGLFGLLLFYAATSFLSGMIAALIYPLVLTFASATALSVVIAVAGSGMLLSSLVMSAWRGPQRRVAGVLAGEAIFGIGLMLIGLRPAILLIALGAFIAHISLPLSYVTNQTIWQAKVAPDAQGRVFAIRQMVGRAATPLAYLLAGPLADGIFNPLLAAHGPLAGNVGRLLGVGAGRGIGLIFVFMGALALAFTGIGMLSPRLRLVEQEIPDTSEEPLVAASI